MVASIVVASPGGWKKPGTMYRVGPLARSGLWDVQVVSVSTFPSDAELSELASRASRRSLLLLRRVLPSTDALRLLRSSFGWIVFDLDDAIYAASTDLDQLQAAKLARDTMRLVVRGSPRRGSRARPLVRTLAHVDACVVGNSILGRFAEPNASRVVEIPSTVAPVAQRGEKSVSPSVIVWLGVAANLQYLRLVRRPLAQLSEEVEFTLRIVSARDWKHAPVETDFVPWSPKAARRALLAATVGIAPLTDDPWTRGKCAFRAIQYGAHGLPTVASPVGITDQVVRHGSTGFLATSEREWLDTLRALVANPSQAKRMGAAALEHITRNYSDEVAVRLWRSLFDELGVSRKRSEPPERRMVATR